MRRPSGARLARWAALAVLALGVFEACSSTTDTTLIAPGGPPVLSFGVPATDSNTLGCDNTLVVHLDPLNWFLKPPYYCGTQPQCGTLSVSLLETMGGPPLITQRAATANVQIDLTSLVHPQTPQDPTLSQVHYIQAQLIGDSLLPYPSSPGAVTLVTTPVSLSSSSVGCTSDASVGGAAGATSGNAGAAGATIGEGGANGGSGAGGGGSGTAGSGGSGAAGSGGLAGSANEGGADTGAGGSPL
ncbi:MAG TPA: hypothetical protein VK745_15355 [Polyangiaceae bacterium]|nr:hypothetical protein [Polyangiaceae bacterium]